MAETAGTTETAAMAEATETAETTETAAMAEATETAETAETAAMAAVAPETLAVTPSQPSPSPTRWRPKGGRCASG